MSEVEILGKLGLTRWSIVKESTCYLRDLGLIPGLGRSPHGGHGNQLQYLAMENPHGRGHWWTIVRVVTKSCRRLSTDIGEIKCRLYVLFLVTQSCQILASLLTVAYQVPLSMGILQAGIWEWVAVPSSRGSSQHKDQTQVFHIAGRFFPVWATREASSLYGTLQYLSIFYNLIVLWF